jgi:hypothetical protein
MPRCTVCSHSARPQIDLALASGIAAQAIAERHGLNRQAVWRHGKQHLSPEVKAALALKLVRKEGDTRAVLLEEGAGTIEALRAIRAPLFAQFLSAVDCSDHRAAASLAGRLHEGLQISARLTGELMPAAGVNITNIVLSPDYQRLRAELLRVLSRFPDAREAVAAVFRCAGEQAAGEMARSVPRPAPAMIEGTATEVSDAA